MKIEELESMVEHALKVLSPMMADRYSQLVQNAHVAKAEYEEQKAKAFLDEVGNVEERKAKATARGDVQRALRDWAEADATLQKAKNHIQSAQTIISLWQTERRNVEKAESVR